MVLVDADLQHPLELIPQMQQRLQQEGLDIISARRCDRLGEGKKLSFLKRLFYSLYAKLTGLPLQDGITDYSLMRREVVDAILSLKDYHRFSKGIFQWVGFKQGSILYSNVTRSHGQSGWGFWKLVSYALDGIFSFSALPLRLSFFLGMLSSLSALLYGLYTFVDTLIFGNPIKGYPSLLCLIVFFGGLELIVIGIMGEYIARIYEQVKNRPHYILKKEFDDEKN